MIGAEFDAGSRQYAAENEVLPKPQCGDDFLGSRGAFGGDLQLEAQGIGGVELDMEDIGTEIDLDRAVGSLTGEGAGGTVEEIGDVRAEEIALIGAHGHGVGGGDDTGGAAGWDGFGVEEIEARWALAIEAFEDLGGRERFGEIQFQDFVAAFDTEGEGEGEHGAGTGIEALGVSDGEVCAA